MDGFVPISAAAELTGYSYAMVRRLALQGTVTTRVFYGRKCVDLQQVRAYQDAQRALGPSKHTPRRYRTIEEPQAVNETPGGPHDHR